LKTKDPARDSKNLELRIRNSKLSFCGVIGRLFGAIGRPLGAFARRPGALKRRLAPSKRSFQLKTCEMAVAKRCFERCFVKKTEISFASKGFWPENG